MRNTRNLKFRIYGFEVRCASIISHGLVSGKGKQPILRGLKRELAAFRSTVKLTDGEANELWLMCVNEYKSVAKTVWGKRTDNESVYRAIRATLPYLEKIKNGLGRGIENHDKLSYLRDLTSEGIFYLCSCHTRCAEGHKDFQGKVYVSENWRERCPDSHTRRRVASYIRNHRCMTVEEAVGDPVYMVTRPNCRHYFMELGIEEVMHSSAKAMLKRHGMIKTGVNSYEYGQYRNYYERLKALIALRQVCPCPKLEADITETRRIMKKWLSMLSR